MMKRVALLACLVAALPTAASSKTFTLGTDPKAATVTLPDAWDGDVSDGQLEALAPDQTIYISALAVDATDLKAAGQDVAKLLSDQKIVLKQDSRKAMPVTIGGMPGAAISWDATDADGPTQVHLLTLKANPDTEILMLRWGDADAEKDHAADIDGILKSLAPVK